jgi:hypothetical protein
MGCEESHYLQEFELLHSASMSARNSGLYNIHRVPSEVHFNLIKDELQT